MHLRAEHRGPERTRLKNWQRIRLARPDITDYVIHFTRMRAVSGKRPNLFPDRPVLAQPFDVFTEILNDGYIKPSFRKTETKTAGGYSITVRGPDPAVCLTEQPIWAVLATRQIHHRYSEFGIAYHKYALAHQGGVPVIYSDKAIMGRLLRPDESGYAEDRQIYNYANHLARNSATTTEARRF
jgi:hypothetical protein